MDKIMVFMMLLGACVACNTSKHHGTNRNNDIDSLPPTIINPPIKSKPSMSADTTAYGSMGKETYPDLSMLKASEKPAK